MMFWNHIDVGLNLVSNSGAVCGENVIWPWSYRYKLYPASVSRTASVARCTMHTGMWKTGASTGARSQLEDEPRRFIINFTLPPRHTWKNDWTFCHVVKCSLLVSFLNQGQPNNSPNDWASSHPKGFASLIPTIPHSCPLNFSSEHELCNEWSMTR